MFYLIEFSGNSRGIYSSKCIQRKEGTLCIVKHKGGKYEGNIISVNGKLITESKLFGYY